MARRIASRSTSRTTPPRLAPSAMRMPISRVRCATANDIIPATPMAASSSAMVGEEPEQHHVEARLRDRIGHEPAQRSHIGHGERGIDRRQLTFRRRGERRSRRCIRAHTIAMLDAAAARTESRFRRGASWSRPKPCTSPTTPTMVPSRVSCRWLAIPSAMRLPIGSSPGKYRRAAASLITATGGAPARSLQKPAPRFTGMPSTR